MKESKAVTREKKAGNNTGKRNKEKGLSYSNEEVHVGNGGEWHQFAGAHHPVLTTNQGIPVSDNQNSLRANANGPTLLEDFVTSEFQSVSFMRVVRQRMAILS
jgi:hypothetical protein